MRVTRSDLLQRLVFTLPVAFSPLLPGYDAFDEEGEQPYGRIGGWRGRWEMRDEPTECFDDDMRE